MTRPTPAPRPNPRLDDSPMAASKNPALVQSERDFQRQVLALAKLRGWHSYHTWRSDHSAAGWPDLALCRPPRLVLVEVKRQDGTVSPAQRDWLDILARCPGVESYVIRPSDWALLDALLA